MVVFSSFPAYRISKNRLVPILKILPYIYIYLNIYIYIYISRLFISRSSKYESILCWCWFLDLKNNTIFLKVQNVIDREMRYINKETSPKTAIPIYHIIWYGFVCFMGNKCLDEKYCKYVTPYVNLCSRHMDDAMLWHLI